MPGVAKKRIGLAPTDPDASSIVLKAARDAADALRRDGKPEMARAIEETLSALAGAVWCQDLEALTAKHGPQKWARALSKPNIMPGRGTYLTRAELARAFLAEIRAGIDARLTAQRLAVEASNWLLLRGARAGFVGAPRVNHLEAVIAGVELVALRPSADAKAFAIAALLGWGLTREEARNRLKNADC